MSGFWIAVMVIAVVGITTEFIVRVVKLGTKHSENMARIRHGYPTTGGDLPINSKEIQREEYNN